MCLNIWGENDYPIEIAKEANIKALKSGDPVAIATAKVEKARVFSSHTKSIGGLSGSLDDTSVKTTGALLVNAIIICNLFNCLFATVESEQLQNRMFLPHSWLVRLKCYRPSNRVSRSTIWVSAC